MSGRRNRRARAGLRTTAGIEAAHAEMARQVPDLLERLRAARQRTHVADQQDAAVRDAHGLMLRLSALNPRLTHEPEHCDGWDWLAVRVMTLMDRMRACPHVRGPLSPPLVCWLAADVVTCEACAPWLLPAVTDRYPGQCDTCLRCPPDNRFRPVCAQVGGVAVMADLCEQCYRQADGQPTAESA